MTQRIWQIAAGESGRYYHDLFLAHDIMFIGPGRFDEYVPMTYAGLVQRGAIAQSEKDNIDAFQHELQSGDVVLLRCSNRVCAMGLAVAGYAYYPDFDDIHGWDLQHGRRVCWQPHLQPALDALQQHAGLFGAYRWGTISQVRKESVRQAIIPLIEQCVFKHPQDLLQLPFAPSAILTWDEVRHELYDRGLPFHAADNTVGILQRVERLARWYHEHCGGPVGRPTEHEVVAHMTVPLLLALGWSEQLLAVEWKNIDLAAFSHTPTDTESCILVCEAKGRGHGLQNTLKQALKYANALPHARKIVLTEGSRLYVYERVEGQWNAHPTGYLNIEKIRLAHLVPAGTNAIDTIMALSPAGANRPIPCNTYQGSGARITAAVPLVKRMM